MAAGIKSDLTFGGAGGLVQVVWLGTCIAAILLGLDLGLAVGLGVELLSVVLRAQL